MSLLYIEHPSTDPYFNLALEQHVFDALDRAREYFMLWQNDNAIIVGKHQNTAEEVNEETVRRQGIRVARRLSGGGAVYHDLGNLNFTFITDAREGQLLDLRAFCEPVARTLQALGVDAQISGRNDITVDGKKFSGNAQYCKEGRVMHHGTILFDSDLAVVSEALHVPQDKISSKGIKSVRSRVTNLRGYLPREVSLARFKELLLQNLFGGEVPRYALTARDLAAVEALRDARYATWEWNYGASPAWTTRRRRRFEGCGTVEALLDIQKGRIAGLAFCGDFFGTLEPDGLAKRLVGARLLHGDLAAALEGVSVGEYFHGLTREDFLELLLGEGAAE